MLNIFLFLGPRILVVMRFSDLYGLWFLVSRFLAVNLMLRVQGFQGSGF